MTPIPEPLPDAATASHSLAHFEDMVLSLHMVLRSGSSYLDLGAGVASVLSSNATLRIQEVEAANLQCGASMLCQLASAEAGG